MPYISSDGKKISLLSWIFNVDFVCLPSNHRPSIIMQVISEAHLLRKCYFTPGADNWLLYSLCQSGIGLGKPA